MLYMEAYGMFILFLTSCEEGGKYEKTFSEREVQVIDSIVYANRCIDSLRVLATRFAQDGNTFGEIVAYNELGKCYREESRFRRQSRRTRKDLCFLSAFVIRYKSFRHLTISAQITVV